ncbi:MAG: LapA family protein [Geobacteraceae bacterium]
MKVALIAAFVIALVMAFFAVQNAQHAQVSFFGWYYDGPLVIILLLTFGAGVLTSFLAMLPGSLRKSVEISKLKSRVKECSSKLEVFEKKETDVHPSGETKTAQTSNGGEVT